MPYPPAVSVLKAQTSRHPLFLLLDSNIRKEDESVVVSDLNEPVRLLKAHEDDSAEACNARSTILWMG